jgi:hypothetical protein
LSTGARGLGLRWGFDRLSPNGKDLFAWKKSRLLRERPVPPKEEPFAFKEDPFALERSRSF